MTVTLHCLAEDYADHSQDRRCRVSSDFIYPDYSGLYILTPTTAIPTLLEQIVLQC